MIYSIQLEKVLDQGFGCDYYEWVCIKTQRSIFCVKELLKWFPHLNEAEEAEIRVYANRPTDVNCYLEFELREEGIEDNLVYVHQEDEEYKEVEILSDAYMILSKELALDYEKSYFVSVKNV